MEILELVAWVPSVTVSALIGGVVYLSRNLIITRLKSAVEHEYNQKLRVLESELRQTEISLNEKMKEESIKLEGLRTGALGNISKRQDIRFDKRVQATEVIWNTVVEARKFHTLSASIQNLNIQALIEKIKTDPRYAKPFQMLSQNTPIEDLAFLTNAHRVRPHVSILVWSYYAAYEAILTRAILVVIVIKDGLSKEFLGDDSKVKSLLKLALPEFSENIEKVNSNNSFIYLEHLESKLLQAIQEYDLRGIDLDDETINRSKSVIDLSKQLIEAPTIGK